MENHYFDDTHPLRPYTHSAYATPGTTPPDNALRKAPPPKRSGFHPGERNGEWVEIEDHREKNGFVNGQPYTIKEYGPLPDGWSESLPPPTEEELFTYLRAHRNARISNTLWVRERYADELLLGKRTSLTEEQYLAVLVYIQALRDLPAQPGAPWDGGGELTPWPTKPIIESN